MTPIWTHHVTAPNGESYIVETEVGEGDFPYLTSVYEGITIEGGVYADYTTAILDAWDATTEAAHATHARYLASLREGVS